MEFTAKEILRSEVRPALGCTEPAAVALAASAAASLVGRERIEKIEIRLDPNVYKNSLAAAVPGGGGGKGPVLAAALGAVGGDPSLGLQVLRPVDGAGLEKARGLVLKGAVSVIPDFEKNGIFISARVLTGMGTGEAIIRRRHDNLVRLAVNDNEVDIPGKKNGDPDYSAARDLTEFLKRLTLDRLLDLTESLDEQDLDFLMEGVEMNRRLAEHGLASGSGLGVGRGLMTIARRQGRPDDLASAAGVLAAAAADARMSGAPWPAMSSAGSGNHGLTAVLPVWAVFEIMGGDYRKMLRAVGLSHLTTAAVKAHTGRLSAVCGCSIAAGAGAAAGTAYLLGGGAAHIQKSVINVMADLAGVVCDGAKASCALKLATAGSSAVRAALLALEGVAASASDGLAGSVFEETAANLGLLSRQGMAAVDRAIIDIISGKPHGPEQFGL